MFSVQVDNDNGLNRGKERNSWCGILMFGEAEVFKTAYYYNTASEATNAVNTMFTQKLRALMGSTRPLPSVMNPPTTREVEDVTVTGL